MPKRRTTTPSRKTQSKRKSPKSKRVSPPVSKATGGLRPGVTIDPFSKYQEMEDLEYVERMRRSK